jgi:hypothetical protein
MISYCYHKSVKGVLTNVANNLSRTRLDLSPSIPYPKIRHGLASRTNLQSTLPGLLEQKRQKTPVRMGPSPKVPSRDGRLLIDGKVMQQPRGRLRIRA